MQLTQLRPLLLNVVYLQPQLYAIFFPNELLHFKGHVQLRQIRSYSGCCAGDKEKNDGNEMYLRESHGKAFRKTHLQSSFFFRLKTSFVSYPLTSIVSYRRLDCTQWKASYQITVIFKVKKKVLSLRQSVIPDFLERHSCSLVACTIRKKKYAYLRRVSDNRNTFSWSLRVCLNGSILYFVNF